MTSNLKILYLSFVSLGRSKRQKHDRHGRLAALQKLKGLKGTKNKYDVEDVDNVYEEVDEREYSKRVQKRQEDDWIIDDGNTFLKNSYFLLIINHIFLFSDGSGYIEDGREVFDDDLADGEVDKRGTRERNKKKEKGVPVKSSNIRNMFMNQPTKNKDVLHFYSILFYINMVILKFFPLARS